MENTKLMIEVPTSLMKEVNKFLAEKSKGYSVQGMKRTIVVSALHSFLLERDWKMNNSALKDCIEVINNGRFQI